MKKLITLFAVIALFGCEDQKAIGVEKNLIYDATFYQAFKLKVDSVEYIVVRSTNGISIIKHGDVKNK